MSFQRAFTTGPSYGPSGIAIPGSSKNLTTEYYGQVDGTLVKFGKNNQPASGSFQKAGGAMKEVLGMDGAAPGSTIPGYLRHRAGPQGQSQQEKIVRGVDTTKFKKGFWRRPESMIQPSSFRDSFNSYKEDRCERHRMGRMERLGRMEERNGMRGIMSNAFNPINGYVPPPLQPAKNSDEPSLELQRIGHIQLRDSLSRFYLPHYSGDNHDRRQKVLVSEGLVKEKHSSLLSLGSSDLKSNGVEDQFSKSLYSASGANPQPLRVEGLVERCYPGRFTPRKTGVNDVGMGGGGIGLGTRRGFVPPRSSRGREMEDARTEVGRLN